MPDKVAIEVDQNSALARHIEDLQRVITTRNKRIDELEYKLTGEGSEEFVNKRVEAAYREGWKHAMYEVQSEVGDVKRSLSMLKGKAFQVSLGRRETR